MMPDPVAYVGRLVRDADAVPAGTVACGCCGCGRVVAVGRPVDGDREVAMCGACASRGVLRNPDLSWLWLADPGRVRRFGFVVCGGPLPDDLATAVGWHCYWS